MITSSTVLVLRASNPRRVLTLFILEKSPERLLRSDIDMPRNKKQLALFLVKPHRLTRIPNSVVNLPPTTADLLENQQRVAIKATLIGKDFSHAVTVKIKLVNKVYA